MEPCHYPHFCAKWIFAFSACGAGGRIEPGVEPKAEPQESSPRNTVLRDLKANASGWMHNVFPDLKDFSWQRGYGAFTVSQSNVERVQDYIARQKEHHQKKSFRDEFIEFLEANGIEYNEEYL
jgi:REP-associated tyrosine transposase